MSVLGLALKAGIAIYALSALMPLSKSDEWWIRIFDFPRLQALALGLVLGAIYLATSGDLRIVKVGWLSCLVIGAGFDLLRILPYSPLWRIESTMVSHQGSQSFSLFILNVLQQNENSKRLLSLIEKKSPDIILLLEVNQRWVDDLKSLESEYPFRVLKPLENEYGLALYSRLPLENAEIQFLVEPTIPSVRTNLKLLSGEVIELYGVHPRPPRHQDGPTTERDAELVLIAKAVREARTPVIVMGDFNDVAWSHTTRLFRRISGLLDPRVGRGPFATFPALFPFLRFPLDYVFHSESLGLTAIERLEDVGSDHLPMYMVLTTGSKSKTGSAPEPDQEDFKEAKDTLKRADEKNGSELEGQ